MGFWDNLLSNKGRNTTSRLGQAHIQKGASSTSLSSGSKSADKRQAGNADSKSVLFSAQKRHGSREPLAGTSATGAVPEKRTKLQRSTVIRPLSTLSSNQIQPGTRNRLSSTPDVVSSKNRALKSGIPEKDTAITISKSAPSLNTNATRRVLPPVISSRQDSSGYKSRGQTQQPPQVASGGKLEAPTPPPTEDLSRASSVSNLDVKGGSGNKGAFAKLKKSASKDKLDKLPDKRHERKVSKNNNKLDSLESPLSSINPAINCSTDPLLDVDFLKRQLAQMADEKSCLALELGTQKGELQLLRQEIAKLKMFKDHSSIQLEQLNDENTALRNRLRDVAHSPLSDNEKQQLLDTHRHHNSAPASIATNPELGIDGLGASGGDITACTTPDWDRNNSSSNISEVSLACLQDKINQMQETHYSTNEELQATLQELTDLQRQLTEIQVENDRLNDEKNLMFESLCRQTERLTDSRSEVDSLKQLLYRDKDDGQLESIVDREQRLVELLKSAQEERESLLVKQDQLQSELSDSRQSNVGNSEEIQQLSERVRNLESTLDAKHAEHRQLDQELALAKDQSSGRHIEINRLTQLLENARTKISELEQDRDLRDKSELDEMLDNARKEKDALESEVANLKEQIARTRVEKEKLKEQVSVLQEECKVTRNNAKCTQSELEYRCEQLKTEKSNLMEQLQQLQETASELQVQAQCQQEDKRQLTSVLSETQRHLNETERRNNELEAEITELKHLRDEENSEWEKFQNDLLTSVRVANDFKTEAQQDLQNMILENKMQRERVRILEAQIDKLKVPTAQDVSMTDNVFSKMVEEPLKAETVYIPPAAPFRPLATSTTDALPIAVRPSSYSGDDASTRRQKATLSRQNSRQSVKSLIESIENASGVKQPKCNLAGSRSSSTSSLNSLASDCTRTPGSPTNGGGPPSLSPLRSITSSSASDWGDTVKAPLREQQVTNKQQNAKEWSKSILADSLSMSKGVETSKSNSKSEEIRDNIIASTNKSLDYARRNSYSEISERKDPLNGLVKNGGSKRNALLKWCQNKTIGYRNIDITNFSSSWNDGLALCAILHTYLPDRVPYDSLTASEKRRNFSIAFAAAESIGINTTLNVNDMIQLERPDWQQVMQYVTSIYKHFEI